MNTKLVALDVLLRDAFPRWIDIATLSSSIGWCCERVQRGIGVLRNEYSRVIHSDPALGFKLAAIPPVPLYAELGDTPLSFATKMRLLVDLLQKQRLSTILLKGRVVADFLPLELDIDRVLGASINGGTLERKEVFIRDITQWLETKQFTGSTNSIRAALGLSPIPFKA